MLIFTLIVISSALVVIFINTISCIIAMGKPIIKPNQFFTNHIENYIDISERYVNLLVPKNNTYIEYISYIGNNSFLFKYYIKYENNKSNTVFKWSKLSKIIDKKFIG